MSQKNIRKLEKKMKYTLNMLIQTHNLLKVMRNEHLAHCMSVFEMIVFSITCYCCSSYLELHIYISLAQIALSR